MYKATNPVMLRMPIYSYREYRDLDFSKNIEEIVGDYGRRLGFLKALAISSPTFFKYHQEVAKSNYSEKYKDSMLKYISRATSRATPFGGFSLVSFANLGQETSFLYRQEEKPFFIHSIDADLFWKIIYDIENDLQVYPKLKVIINPNLYFSGNRVKNPYVSKLGQTTNQPFQASIRATKQFEAIVNFTTAPIRIEDLESLLYDFNKGMVEMTVIREYIFALVENEFLLSELRSLDVNNGLSKVVDLCESVGIKSRHLTNIKVIENLLYRLNQLEHKEEQNAWVSAYEKLYDFCKEMYGKSNIINSMLFAPQYRVTLGKNVANSVSALEHFAIATALPDNETPQVTAWKNRFIEKYGPYAEISFVELFDDNSGIGDPYENKNYAYIDKRTNGESAKKRTLLKVIERKLLLALGQHEKKIIFTDSDVAALGAFSTKLPFAPSADLGINVFGKNEAAIAAGDFTIQVMENVGVRDAGAHLSRFQGGMGEEANMAYQKLQEQKRDLAKNRYVEVFVREIPRSSRTANIANPKSTIKYSLNLGMGNTENNIFLTDLYIGYNRKLDRLYIKSKQLDKIIKLSIDGVLNTFASNHVIRFLREISMGYEIDPLSGIVLCREAQYDYMPEIWYKNVLIQSARWKVKSDAYEKLSNTAFTEQFCAVKKRLGFGKYFYISELDRDILINSESNYSMQFLFRQLKKKGEIVVKQCTQEENTWCHNEANQPMHAEFIVPLILQKPDTEVLLSGVTSNQRRNTTQYNIPLGEENYIYVKMYMDMEYADSFIVSKLASAVEHFNKEKLLERFFFIRYADPRFHIRLRLQAPNKNAYVNLLLAVQDWLRQLYHEKELSEYSFTIYEREVERYGGEACFHKIEELFWADSKLAISLLPYKEKLSKQEWQVLFSWILAQTIIDLTPPGEIRKVLFSPVVGKDARQEYRTIRNKLLYLINRKEIEAQYSEIAEVFETRRAICYRLKTFFENASLTNSLQDIVGSIIHMTANRISGDRFWEQEITAYAMKTLKSHIYLHEKE